MLVQNTQNNSVFASGIFSVSGEKMQSKADNALMFSKLFDGMNKTDADISKTEIKGAFQKQSQDSSLSTDVKNTSADAKLNVRNIKGKAVADETKGTAKTGAQETAEPDVDDIEKISTCLVHIVITVVEFFNITPEELQVQMDALGMKASDLADQDSLKQLFISLDCDNDISKLLTDQNLLDSFEGLVEDINNILEASQTDATMISAVLESCFGKEENFRIDLLKEGESVKDLPEQKLGENEEEENFVPVAGPEETEETKELTIQFEKNGDNREESRSDRKKNDNVQDNAALADRFVNNMVDKFRQNMMEVSGIEKAVGNLRAIADQILNQIKINLTADITNLEIRLTPEHLGRVNVQISESDGVITAKFHTENQVSKEAIESNIIQFKESLREQGIKVDSVEVTVSDFSFAKDQEAEKNGQGQNENKNKRHFTLEEVNEMADGKDLKSQSYIDDGTSTVSYVA